MCGESKSYDKNNSDLFARATPLQPQYLTYLNSWLVVVVDFVCLFVCVCVFVCMCVSMTIASTKV